MHDHAESKPATVSVVSMQDLLEYTNRYVVTGPTRLFVGIQASTAVEVREFGHSAAIPRSVDLCFSNDYTYVQIIQSHMHDFVT